MGEQELLRKLGIWPNLSGYQYLMKGFEMIRMDPDYLQYVTKRLYPDIADVYQMSWPSVERAIRTSLITCWDRGCLLYTSLIADTLWLKSKIETT